VIIKPSFSSGKFKLKSLSVFKHLEKAWDIRANYLPKILFEHIPRESNKFSDHAAGLASKSLLLKRNTDALNPQSEDNTDKQDPTKIYLPLPVLELNPEVFQNLENRSLRLIEACQQPHPCTLYLCSCSFPDTSTQLDKLGRFLKQMTPGVLPDDGTFRYFATYKPAPAELDGRVYATTITAQTLSKDFRHLLFHDHFEIDLTLAHLNLLILDQKREKQTTLTIGKLKQQLDNLLRGMAFNLYHPNPAKRIIYKILNTSAAETIKDIYNTDIVPPAELLHLIREIDRLKKNFISEHHHDQVKQQHHNDQRFVQ
jgi:hypothetical protein